MAARGLAPRRTVPAVRVARTRATAYSATACDHLHRGRGADGPFPPGRVGHRGQGVEGVAAAAVEDQAGLRPRRRGSRWRWRARTGRAGSPPAGRCPSWPIGVLGADDQVGTGEGPRLAVHRHLLLLHGLEEGRLGPGRRPVELVEQDDMGEHRSGPEVPRPGVRGEDGHAGDVGGEQVGVALDPGELDPEGGGQGPGQHGLAHAGDVLDEQVAPRQGGDHREGDRPSGCPRSTSDRAGCRAGPAATASSMDAGRRAAGTGARLGGRHRAGAGAVAPACLVPVLMRSPASPASAVGRRRSPRLLPEHPQWPLRRDHNTRGAACPTADGRPPWRRPARRAGGQKSRADSSGMVASDRPRASSQRGAGRRPLVVVDGRARPPARGDQAAATSSSSDQVPTAMPAR